MESDSSFLSSLAAQLLEGTSPFQDYGRPGSQPGGQSPPCSDSHGASAARYADSAADGKVERKEFMLRAKNRRSQTRYRAKQKERRQTTEQQIKELQQQLQRSSANQASLKQRNAELEALVAEQQLLQRDSSPMPSSPVAGPDAVAAAMGNAAAEEPCSNGCADASWQDVMMQALLADELQLAEGFVFTVRPRAPVQLTQAQVAAMPRGELAALWQQYLHAFAALLLRMRGDTQSSAAHRLARLVFEGLQLKAFVLASRQERLAALQADASDVMELTSDAWLQAADAAELTARQRDAISALRQGYLGNLAVLAARRRLLTAQLQGALPLCTTQQCDVTGKFQQSISAAKALCVALRLEHANLLQFTIAVTRRVLAPSQAAALDVAAFQAGAVDMPALAEALAEAAGEAPAAQLMKQGAGGQLVQIDAVLSDEWMPWTALPPTADAV